MWSSIQFLLLSTYLSLTADVCFAMRFFLMFIYTQRLNDLRIKLSGICLKIPTDKGIHAERCVCIRNELCRFL